MSLTHPAASWPPEVPPPYRPGRPWQPSPPQRPAPDPILPTWEEHDVTPRHRDIVDRLLAQRIIHVGGHLDTALANRVTAQLLLLGRREHSPIELHLTCRDSDLDASLALADTVDIIAAQVHAIVHGMLRGPAVAVLCAAQERGARRGATLVLSLPRAAAEGTAEQLVIHAEQHERQVARLREIIAHTTGRGEVEVEDDLSAGRVLSADEAFDYGLLNRLL